MAGAWAGLELHSGLVAFKRLLCFCPPSLGPAEWPWAGRQARSLPPFSRILSTAAQNRAGQVVLHRPAPSAAARDPQGPSTPP